MSVLNSGQLSIHMQLDFPALFLYILKHSQFTPKLIPHTRQTQEYIITTSIGKGQSGEITYRTSKTSDVQKLCDQVVHQSYENMKNHCTNSENSFPALVRKMIEPRLIPTQNQICSSIFNFPSSVEMNMPLVFLSVSSDLPYVTSIIFYEDFHKNQLRYY